MCGRNPLCGLYTLVRDVNITRQGDCIDGAFVCVQC
jgi:hypothetical protein